MAHDIKDDPKQGGVMANEVMRRLTSGSEDILGHCVVRGMVLVARIELIVVVLDIERIEGYRSPLSVDHYLKPGQYLKGKFQSFNCEAPKTQRQGSLSAFAWLGH